MRGLEYLDEDEDDLQQFEKFKHRKRTKLKEKTKEDKKTIKKPRDIVKLKDLHRVDFVNIAKCLDCGHEAPSEEFPVISEEELEGQMICLKCGSENVEW